MMRLMLAKDCVLVHSHEAKYIRLALSYMDLLAKKRKKSPLSMGQNFIDTFNALYSLAEALESVHEDDEEIW